MSVAGPLRASCRTSARYHGTLVRACLRSPADFTRVGTELEQDEAAQGTGYVEVMFTAASHGERLGDPDMPLDALLAGLRRGWCTTRARRAGPTVFAKPWQIYDRVRTAPVGHPESLNPLEQVARSLA
jgi:hypothetical protein